jgi:hypothetical protein
MTRTTMKIKAYDLRGGYQVVGKGEVEFAVPGLDGKDSITTWFVDVDDPEVFEHDEDIIVFADDVDF